MAPESCRLRLTCLQTEEEFEICVDLKHAKEETVRIPCFASNRPAQIAQSIAPPQPGEVVIEYYPNPPGGVLEVEATNEPNTILTIRCRKCGLSLTHPCG